MILRYLQLENFLSHQDEEVSFPGQGMFLLAGESGAGKSSLIIDATAYALFGAAAVTRAKRQSELVTDHLVGEQEMKVKAIFDLSGQTLVVERGIAKNGQPWARVYSGDDNNSQLLAEGPKAVSRVLTSRLGGMTWQQFFAAFVARQDEISLLTSLRGAERKNLIHRMLGMRELEKSTEIIANRRRRVKAERQQLQLSLGNFDPQAAEQEIAEMQDDLSAQEQRIADMSQELVDKEEELAKQLQRHEQLAEQAQLFEQRQSFQQEHQELGAKLQEAQQRVVEHQQALRAEQQLPELKQSLERQQAEVEQLRQEYLRAERISALQQQLSSLDDQSPTASNEDVEELRAQIAGYQAEAQGLRENLQQEEDNIKLLAEEQSCYLCQRPFASGQEHEHLLQQRQEHLAAQEQRLAAVEQSLGQAQQRLPEVRQQVSERQQEEQDRQALQQLQEQRAWPEEDQQQLAQRGREARQESDRLQEEFISAEASRRHSHPQAEGEVRELEEKLQAVEKKLAQLPEDSNLDPEQENAHQRSEQLCQDLQQEITALQARIPEAQSAQQRSKQQLDNLQQALTGRENEARALKDYQQQQETLERLSTYLQGFQNQLVAEIRPALEEIGSEMLMTVSDGKYQRMIIDQDYEISVRSAEGTERRAAILSGGEQIRVNLCLRLALTRLVSQRTGVPVGFLILDEPLPSQDQGHVERILNLLASLKPFYQQQFIISHVGNIRNASELDYLIEFSTERQPGIELAQA